MLTLVDKLLQVNPNELMFFIQNHYVADMRTVTKSMCWDLVVIAKDKLNGVAAAIYRKPSDNECYERRSKNEPPMCSESDDPNAAWYIYFLFSITM
jgi:hypothetical protein